MEQLTTAQQDVVERFNQLEGSSEKRQTLQAMQSGVFPEGDAGKTQIWMTLLAVLGLTLVICAVGAIILLINSKDTSAAVLLGPVSAIIAGVFGLFAKSPVS